MKYTEIFKLKDMLENANIKFEFKDRTIKNTYSDGSDLISYQICVPSDKDRIISVVQGYGTYGAGRNLLEIMGLLTAEEQQDDCVVGDLTAENVFNRIAKKNK